jgi:glyoxylase-like metal-dependent hydrolase (beta-lactamase superfamily II)
MNKSIPFGKFELAIISDGGFWIDGGAVFGTVPKTIWSQLVKPDELNRVELALNCLLIKTPDKNILVDTGVGEKLSDKVRQIYNIQKPTDLIRSLKGAGLEPDQIDYVINTHLHFDHCGGNTRSLEDNYRPTFPNAQYLVQKKEWDDALHPDDRSRSSYLKENYLPLETAGRLVLIDGDHDVTPGVKIILTPGHTQAHQSVIIQSDGRTALYLGDVVCISQQIKVPYVTSFDLYPVDLMKTRKNLLKRAREERWLLIFDHDPRIPFAFLNEVDGKPILEPMT